MYLFVSVPSLLSNTMRFFFGDDGKEVAYFEGCVEAFHTDVGLFYFPLFDVGHKGGVIFEEFVVGIELSIE